MYILTLKDNESEGAYAVENKHGEKILYLFEEEDDAVRYCSMLEDYQYAIITPDDIVIPPDYAEVQNSTI